MHMFGAYVFGASIRTGTTPTSPRLAPWVQLNVNTDRTKAEQLLPSSTLTEQKRNNFFELNDSAEAKETVRPDKTRLTQNHQHATTINRSPPTPHQPHTTNQANQPTKPTNQADQPSKQTNQADQHHNQPTKPTNQTLQHQPKPPTQTTPKPLGQHHQRARSTTTNTLRTGRLEVEPPGGVLPKLFPPLPPDSSSETACAECWLFSVSTVLQERFWRPFRG